MITNRKSFGKAPGYRLIGLLLIAISLAQPVRATVIHYDSSNLTGNTWQYSYSLINDSLVDTIDMFTVYFPFGNYQKLNVGSAPATWDPLVVEPNNFLQNDGYYDVLALVSGVAPGGKLGSFLVTFDYIGTGTPGAQAFDIVNPITFATLDSGNTTPAPPAVVPVPAGVWLFGSFLVGFIGYSRLSAS